MKRVPRANRFPSDHLLKDSGAVGGGEDNGKAEKEERGENDASSTMVQRHF